MSTSFHGSLEAPMNMMLSERLFQIAAYPVLLNKNHQSSNENFFFNSKS